MRCNETQARHHPCLNRYVALGSERSRMLCNVRDVDWTCRYVRLSVEDRHDIQDNIFVSKSRVSSVRNSQQSGSYRDNIGVGSYWVDGFPPPTSFHLTLI